MNYLNLNIANVERNDDCKHVGKCKSLNVFGQQR